MTRAYNDLKSVSRAAQVLIAFLQVEEWSISGLAKELSLHKSVVHRIVSTLADAGFLACDARSGLYRLGPVIAELGNKVERNGLLYRLARSHLTDLARISDETASLHVAQADFGVCIDIVESPRSMRFTLTPGQSFPLHAGCGGKILLAFQDERFIETLLSRTPLQRYTDRTLTDPKVLRENLADIRATGIGFSEAEITPGARSVGAPVFGSDGKIAASLVISGPEFRLSDARISQLEPELIKAAKELSAALGHLQHANTESSYAFQ